LRDSSMARMRRHLEQKAAAQLVAGRHGKTGAAARHPRVT